MKGLLLKDFYLSWRYCRAFLVIVAVSEENYRVRRLKELLPEGFGPFNLNGGQDENSFL